MNELSPSWQGLKEKVHYSCTFIQESAQIVSESVSYLAFQAVHMIFPSIAPRLENMYLRVSNIWERIKTYFEKKELERENAELNGRVQQLTGQLLSASQRENDLLDEVGTLKQSNLHMQSQMEKMQKLIGVLTAQNLRAERPSAVVGSVNKTLVELQRALTALCPKSDSNEGQ